MRRGWSGITGEVLKSLGRGGVPDPDGANEGKWRHLATLDSCQSRNNVLGPMSSFPIGLHNHHYRAITIDLRYIVSYQ